MEESFKVRKPSTFGSLSRDFYYANLLIDEVIAENIVAVKLLLEKNKARADTVVPERGAAALHLLAGMENEDFSASVTLMTLLRTGADPNVRSEEGLTPVHVAATYGRCKVLEVLLINGGDPNILDYRLLLDAEGHAMRQQQWRAHFMLTSYAAIVEDPDHFAKYVEEVEDNTMYGQDLSVSESQPTAGSGAWSTEEFKESNQGFEDYDWLRSAFDLHTLDDNSLRKIKSHREKTKTYQYPAEGNDEDGLTLTEGSREIDQNIIPSRTCQNLGLQVNGIESSSSFQLIGETDKESTSSKYSKKANKRSSSPMVNYPTLEMDNDSLSVLKYPSIIDREGSSSEKYIQDTASLNSFKTKLCKIISNKHCDILSNENQHKGKGYRYPLRKVNQANIPTTCLDEHSSTSSSKTRDNFKESGKEEQRNVRHMKNKKDTKKKRESEMYYCGFAEEQVFSSKGSRPSSSYYCRENDSFISKIPSNRMLCKMSRVFLFILKKRNSRQESRPQLS